MASPACMKMAGVPVEFKVATIFEAIMALLPIPEIMTLPFEFNMHSTALEKSSSSKEARCPIASLSFSIVLFANSRIVLLDVNVLFVFINGIRKRCVIFKNTKLRKLNFIVSLSFNNLVLQNSLNYN